MSIEGLDRLETWKKAKDFAVRVYREILPLLPVEEKWAMNQQIRRSSQSIPANIAEGYGRYYCQDNVRFCYIAPGSLEETLTYHVLAYEMGYIPKQLYEMISEDGEGVVRLINGYIAYLKRTRKGSNEPGANLSVNEESDVYEIDSMEESTNL